MKRGFMDYIATILVPKIPGETEKWYAKTYLDEQKGFGNIGSDAKKPVESLANTLAKQVREGKETRIRRARIRGEYRYFPANSTSNGEENGDRVQSIAVQVALSAEELEILDNFVAVDRFRNKNEVLVWLVREGIRAKREDIEKVAQVRKQIEELKKSIPKD